LVLEPDASSLLSKLFAILHDEYSEYELVEAVIAQGGLKKRRSGSIEPSPRQAVGISTGRIKKAISSSLADHVACGGECARNRGSNAVDI